MYKDRYTDQHNLHHQKYSKWNKRKKSTGDFGIYCSQLMKQSLITGFSVIAESKSNVRRIIKLLVFLICTAGFFYQTYYFLEMYLAYPTILDINVLNPEFVDIPAVTICNRNRMRRKKFCTDFRNKCEFRFHTREDFCGTYPMLCSSSDSDDEIVFGIPDFRLSQKPNRSLEWLEIAGLDKSEFLTTCKTMIGAEGINCDDEAVVVQAASKGVPNNCFSVLSLWKKPDKYPEKIPLTGSITFVLSMQPEEYMFTRDLIQAYVYIHNPHSIANAQAEGLTLMAGKKYRIYIRKDYRKSLPPPYKTNCTDYMKKWRENGGQGPITMRGCIEQCKIDAMMKDYGCVSQTVTYPNSYIICDDQLLVPSDETITRCSEDCSDACEEELYFTTTEITDDIAAVMCSDKSDVNCQHKKLMFEVSFSRMVITKYKHNPKYESVEMFSYIGGYMGMWLGLSLVSLFDFVEMLADVLAYPVIKWKKKNKKKRRINNMLRRHALYDMYDI